MSLSEMTWIKIQHAVGLIQPTLPGGTDILVSEMLQQLEFSVRALGQDRGAEGLHDLLDGHILTGELIFGRAEASPGAVSKPGLRLRCWGHQGAGEGGPYQTRPKAPMPTGWRSEYLYKYNQPGLPDVLVGRGHTLR